MEENNNSGLAVKLWVSLGILGATFVALGMPLEANVVWLVGNAGLVLHNRKTNQREQTIMFTVYWFIAVFGVINLW